MKAYAELVSDNLAMVLSVGELSGDLTKAILGKMA